MNIYVSHLSWGTKGDSLQNLFSQYGEVSSANVSPTAKRAARVASAS